MKNATAQRAGRRHFLLGSSAIAGSLTLGRAAHAQGPKVLKVAHVEAANSSLHQAFARMAQAVQKQTAGAIDVQLFAAGQLGGYRDIVEGMRLGTVDIVGGGMDYTANLVPQMLTGVLYYVWQSPQHAARALDGGLGERYSAAMSSRIGVRIIAWGDYGMRDVFTRNKVILKPADMRGLKIRVPEARHHVLAMRALGANPTPIPYGEVYTSIQTGVVDGAEGTPSAIVQQKFNEVSKNLSMTGHQLQVMHALLGEKSAARLSKAELDILVAATREAFVWQRQAAVAENSDALAKIRAAGVKVDQPDVAAFRDVVRSSWKELIDPLGAEGADLLRQIESAAK